MWMGADREKGAMTGRRVLAPQSGVGALTLIGSNGPFLRPPYRNPPWRSFP